MSIFPYTELPSRKRITYSPLLNVRLNYKKTHKITHPISALVDSGADICMCSKDIGIWLGIDFRKLKEEIELRGISNCPIKAVKENVNLIVNNKDYLCPFYFSEDYPPNKPLILGQIGFLDHFIVSFDYRNKKFEVS
jgi:hypothetical protein